MKNRTKWLPSLEQTKQLSEGCLFANWLAGWLADRTRENRLHQTSGKCGANVCYTTGSSPEKEQSRKEREEKK